MPADRPRRESRTAVPAMARVPAAARPAVVRLAGSRPARVARQSVRALVRAEVLDRSMTLAAQAFTSVFPLLILVATLRPGAGNQVGRALADSLGLDPQARAALEAALPPAGTAANGFGIAGIIVVLLSATSFSRALARMYARVWDAQRPGRLRSLWRLVAVLLGLVLLVGLLTFVRRVLQGSPLSGLTEGAVALLIGCPLWTWVPWLLLARRVPARLLVPGGVLMAAATAVLTVAGRIYLPRALSSATGQYGALGVSFTYVTWLFVIMAALVGSTAVGAVIAREVDPAGGRLRGAW
jgi:membrane protein